MLKKFRILAGLNPAVRTSCSPSTFFDNPLLCIAIQNRLDNDGRERDPSEHSHDAKFSQIGFLSSHLRKTTQSFSNFASGSISKALVASSREGGHRPTVRGSPEVWHYWTEWGVFDDILQPNYSRSAELHQVREKRHGH